MPFLPLMMLIGSIAFINIMLSGDNVLVISALLAIIAPDRRRLVLALGGSGAIVLRIICTLLVASWLNYSFAQAIGGLLILFTAIQLLSNQEHNVVQSPQEVSATSMTRVQHYVKQPVAAGCLTQLPNRLMRNKLSSAQKGLLGGIVAIVLADSTTSLDNIIAIGALGATSGANHLPLALGLAFSMTLMFIVSTRLALLIQRLPWLTFVASLVLAIRAGGLITAAASEALRITSIHLGQYGFPIQWFIYYFCCLVVILPTLRYFLIKISRKKYIQAK
jgi:predicted tellurium resistance membrane protein TerC